MNRTKESMDNTHHKYSKSELILGRAPTICTFLFGLLYVLGFLVVNIYLYSFGIFEISPLQIRYVISGLPFLIILLAPYGIIFFPVYLIKKLGKGFFASGLAFIFFTVCLFIFMSFFLSCIFNTPINNSFVSFLKPWKSYFSMGIYFPIILIFSYTFGTIIIKGILKEESDHAMLPLFVPLLCLSFGVFLCLWIYIQDIHKDINIGFGGGKVRDIELLLSDEGIKVVHNLGLTPGNEKILRAKLIYENKDNYFLVPHPSDNKAEKRERIRVKSICFPKSFTEGTRYLSEESSTDVKDEAVSKRK